MPGKTDIGNLFTQEINRLLHRVIIGIVLRIDLNFVAKRHRLTIIINVGLIVGTFVTQVCFVLVIFTVQAGWFYIKYTVAV